MKRPTGDVHDIKVHLVDSPFEKCSSIHCAINCIVMSIVYFIKCIVMSIVYFINCIVVSIVYFIKCIVVSIVYIKSARQTRHI